MSNITVGIVVAAAAVGFILGAVIMAGCDFAVVRHSRKQVKETGRAFDALYDACKAVLSPAWNTKVCREFMRRMDALAAKGGEK